MIPDKREQELIRDRQFEMVGEAFKALKKAVNKEDLERKITRLFRSLRNNLNRSYNLSLKERDLK